MASPFTVFRKNQKVLLAITGILAMIAFVFLGTCMKAPGPAHTIQNATVVSWNYGDVTETDMDDRLQMRRILNRFIIEAMSLGGRGRQAGQMFPESEESIVRSMVLERRGREMGVVVSDQMVNQFLALVTNDKVRPAELEGIAANFRQRATAKQIFDSLRQELLAIRVATLFLDGLGVSQQESIPPLDTPAQRWNNFRRLERQASVQVLAVPVAEFTEEVGKPSEEELQDLFEKNKDRFASPDSPDPGFRQPYRARFQYFKADIDELITAEMEHVTEEEVKNYYEANKEKFKKSKLSAIDEGDAKEKAANEAKEGGKQAADAKESGANNNEVPKTVDEPAQKEEGAKKVESTTRKQPATEPTTGAKGNTEKATGPASDTPTRSESKVTPQPAEKKKDVPSQSKSTPDKGQTRLDRSAPFRLVNFQNDKQKQETTPAVSQQKTNSTTAPKDASKNVADGEPKPGGKESAKKEEKNKGPKDEARGKAEEANETKNEAAKDDEKLKAADEAATKADDKSNTAEEVPEYRPLEKVQDEIRRTIARERVEKQVDERLAEIRAEMNRYADKRTRYQIEAAKNPDEPKPKPIDTEALAQKYGVKAYTTEMISLVDAQTSDKLDIAKSRDLNNQSSSFFQPWTQLVFQPRGLFRPYTTKDPLKGSSFVSWKTEEHEGHVPEFKEVRNQVLEAWKRIKARDLAKKKAGEYAAMVRKAKQPMKDVFAQDKNLPVNEVGPFAWLTRPNVPLGMMQQLPPVQYPEIAGVENPGEEFMDTTFHLQPGEVAVALNHPKSVAYVIQVVSFDPLDAVLEQTFMVRMRDYERYQAAGYSKAAEAQNDWMESLFKQYGVNWRRPPDVRLAREE